MKRILLVGFGFMGKMHAGVYGALPDALVAGVVDPRSEAIRGDLCACGLGDLPVFADLASAVNGLEFGAADICLPTDLHRAAVLEAFAAGKDVFCEKPIALSAEDAGAMTEAARRADRHFMVGQCIRFWPEYVELKRMVESGEQGQLLSLSMSRRTGRPGGSAEDWVNQPERCLGAALDLHIHDTDFLHYLLGAPKAVVSQGLRDKTGWSSISTQYVYDHRIVTAEGAWNYPADWGFQMRFSAVFERGALDYDSRAKPTLTLSSGKAEPKLVSVPPHDGYHHEIAYFVGCLERGEPITISTGEQATESLLCVLAEIESAATGMRLNLSS